MSIMNKSFSNFFLVTALAAGACLLVSCKKEVSERPQHFEAGVDGVAVQPLPPIDEEMAKLSLDDLGAVPSHRSTGSADDSYVPASATSSRDEFDDEDTATTVSDDEDEMSDDAPVSFDSDDFDSDDFDSDDANSF